MDPRETWREFSPGNDTSKSFNFQNQLFTLANQDQSQLKWDDDSASFDSDIGIKPHFLQPSETRQTYPDNQIKDPLDDQEKVMIDAGSGLQHWDSQAVLSNLSFLEQKIHQLKDLVHLISGQDEQVLGRQYQLLAQRQQLVTADLTSIIAQLISTAGNLLPSMKNISSTENPFLGQLQNVSMVGGPSNLAANNVSLPQTNVVSQVHSYPNQSVERNPQHNSSGKAPNPPVSNIDEHQEFKDEEDAGEGENLLPGSYVVLQLEKDEILAPHTHFCLICGKGFKRDANLRMHMRGHGDEYKTPAALAKPTPDKESSSEPMLLKRYSCPYVGCKRNKDHKKFQPLKTILCVKNHYKRTHCDKSYTCSKCNTKKFSVIADLKTHEKHCGRDKWLCSCGTTFSRKDKLFGHVALFQGHTPALPADDSKMDGGECIEETTTIASSRISVDQNAVGVKGCLEDATSYFSHLEFDSCNFGNFHDFPRPPFDHAESSLSSCLLSKPCYMQTSGSTSDALL